MYKYILLRTIDNSSLLYLDVFLLKKEIPFSESFADKFDDAYITICLLRIKKLFSNFMSRFCRFKFINQLGNSILQPTIVKAISANLSLVMITERLTIVYH